jgi:hypothetical protein
MSFEIEASTFSLGAVKEPSQKVPFNILSVDVDNVPIHRSSRRKLACAQAGMLGEVAPYFIFKGQILSL